MEHKEKYLDFSIITPTRVVFEGQIDMLVARTTCGSIGIRPEHESGVLLLKDGLVRMVQGDVETEYFVEAGNLLIQPQSVTILAEFSSLPEDVERLHKERTEKLRESYLKEVQSSLDIQRAELALHRSLIHGNKAPEVAVYYEEN